MKYHLRIHLILGIWLAPMAMEQTVVIHPGQVLHEVGHHPVGINLNFLMDDDIRLKPQKSLSATLKEMGVKWLRYPGGEKSDAYLWSKAPWSTAQPAWARSGPSAWPSNEGRFTSNGMPNPNTMDFDEFLDVLDACQCQAMIVVNADGYLNPPSGGFAASRDSLLKTAEEWVRYANIVKGKGIKYWMVGNETWNSGSYNGVTDAWTYAQDVRDFADRMKAVDPSIKIIANGNGRSWWQVLLQTAGASIDALGVSDYPVWQWNGGYSYWEGGQGDLDGKINEAKSAILDFGGNRASQIQVISAEYNAIDWAGNWASVNDWGHALVNASKTGRLLNDSKVELSFFWNTRWVNNDQQTELFDVLDRYGNITPQGRALEAFGRFQRDAMVRVEASSPLEAYASKDSEGMTLWIINKSGQSQSIIAPAIIIVNNPQHTSHSGDERIS